MRSACSTDSPARRRLARWQAGRLARLAAAATLLSGCAGIGGIGSGGSGEPAVAPAADAAGSADAPVAAPISRDADVPEAIRSRYAQAVFLLETGDQHGAEAELKRFVADYPDYPGPHINLALIYGAQGRDDEAMAALQQALQRDPASAAALNQIGILHRKAGRFGEAEAAYLKAITVNPDYALAHYNLGVLNDLYFGRLDQALSAYESYQALTPTEDPEVARWIVDLSRRVGTP